jgi:hypothetical protein
VLQEFYVGKEFIFSLRAIRLSGLASNASPIFAHQPRDIFVRYMEIGAIGMAKSTLQRSNGSSCPKPIAADAKSRQRLSHKELP